MSGKYGQMASDTINSGKKAEKPVINYLTLDGIRILLSQPDQSTRIGRRDIALLSLLYDSAARVSEIINLTPAMLRLDSPCIVKLIGKENKARIVPLLDKMMDHINSYSRKNLCNKSHYEMFSFLYGEEMLKKLSCSVIPANEIILQPWLLRK